MFVPLTCHANSAPTFTSVPRVNATRLVADEATAYTVSATVSDADGNADIRCIRVMFDFTEANMDPAKARGYLAWGVSDAEIGKYGGNWAFADATGGYRWAYMTDSWGGTTYISPVSCSTSVGGNATGGAGYRSVSWTFKVKPAWANNPLVNDADYWVSDSASAVGWTENTNDFDVLGYSCATTAQTPSAPLLSNPASNTIDLSINPADSSTDVFSIKVSPAPENRAYVQADGSLGYPAVWRTRAEWATTTVSGLSSSTTYQFRARAFLNSPGVCPSSFSSASSLSTTTQQFSIDAAVQGKPISSLIYGNATRLDVAGSYPSAMQKVWEAVAGTSARGIAGGLDADTYNWKDMSGQGVGHTGAPPPSVPTTLGWLQSVRDRGATPVVTANLRGIGPLESSGYSRFYYTDTSIGTVSALAVDWLRYINHILPTYRQGDTLSAQDQAVLDSISWFGRPKLLPPAEPAVPNVHYWEIGNEPELGLPWSTPGATIVAFSPQDYAARYKQVTSVMLAVDPSIEVGPCITTANGANAHLDAVLNDPAARVDFVSYHPYGPLYPYANNYGDTADTAERALRYVKQQQMEYYNGIVSHITASGRSAASVKFMASEWNPSDWHWEMTQQAARMSHALGVAETVFTYAELGLLSASYWSTPTYADGTETPAYKLFEVLPRYGAGRLVSSSSDGNNLRVYTVWNAQSGEMSIWVLNFSDTVDKPVRFALGHLPSIDRVTQMRLAKLTGETGLLDRNDPPFTAPPAIDWTTTDLTGSVDPSDFTLTIPHATVTLIRLHQSLDLPNLKAAQHGAFVSLNSMLVSAVFDDFFYVEADDRVNGLRVHKPGHGVTVGTRVSVAGIVRTNADGEREVEATDVVQVAGGA